MTEEEIQAYAEMNSQLQDACRQIRSHFSLESGCLIIGQGAEGTPIMVAVSSMGKEVSIHFLESALVMVKQLDENVPSGKGMMELLPPTEGSA